MINAQWYAGLAKNDFPVTLRLEPQYEDGPTYEVEVFGLLDLSLPIAIFRTTWISIEKVRGGIEMLPAEEFGKRFKRYSFSLR